MPDVLSFDYSIARKKPFIEFHNGAQFAPLVDQLVRQAASESRQLEAQIGNIHSVAKMLHEDRGGGWPTFNSAIACGMAGDMEAARALFRTAYDSIGAWRPDLQRLLDPYAEAIKEKEEFTNFVMGQINSQRKKYGFSPIADIDGRTTLTQTD